MTANFISRKAEAKSSFGIEKEQRAVKATTMTRWTDNVGVHRGLADDQASHNPDGIPQGARQTHAGLPQKFKGQLHQKHLHTAGKGTPCRLAAKDNSSVVGRIWV